MPINLTGLNSGIDTGSIIQQLMAVEGRRLTLLQNNQATQQQKQNALGTLTTKLNSFQTAVKALDNAQTLRGYNATSSDSDLVTADASYNAFEGNHTVVVNQLASAERIVHSGKAYAEDLVGAGKFIYSYDHKETVITTTATTTLNDLVGLINNDPANPGVTASILQYDDGSGGVYHLVLSGNDSGSDYNISINSSNTNVLTADSAYKVKGVNADGSTKISSLDQLGSADKITISGASKNGDPIAPIDLTITHDTTIDRLLDAITSAYGGAATAVIEDGKIKLIDNADGTSSTSLTLTFSKGADQLDTEAFAVSTQGGSVTGKLDGFEADTFTQTQAAANSMVQVDGYPKDTLDLDGKPVHHWIERSSNTLDDIIPGVTLNLHAPGTVQVNLTRQTDSFKDKLSALVTAYNDVVSYVQQQTAYDADSKTAGILMGDSTVTDVRSQLRTPLMSQVSGFTQNTDSFVMPGHIGLEVDGTGQLKLDQTKLSNAITKNYMGVLDLVGAAKTGSSDSNAIKFYSANDNTAAGEYNVEVTFNNGTITAARIKSTSDSAWRTATWEGNQIIGNSQFDSKGHPKYPENGLYLTADYSGTGTLTATVRVKEGFAGKLEDNVKNILESQHGSIQIDKNGLNDSLKQIQTNIDREQNRLTKVEADLKAKFARMEAVLSQLQQQRSALGLS